MEYRVLGQVGAFRDDEPLRMAPQASIVLVALLLSPNLRAHRDDILQNVWPGQRRSLNSLYIQLSKLRLTLGENAIPAQQAGWYRIVADEDSVDILRFRRLVRQAATAEEPAVKAALLEAALQEVRGVPLRGLDGPWISGRQMELIQQWQQTTEDCFRAHIDAQAIPNALTRGWKAIDTWPAELRFHRMVLRTIYQINSAGEFTQAFGRCLRTAGPALKDELEGLKDELEQGPQPPHREAAATTSFAPQQLPAHRTTLVGRNADIDRLCADLTERQPSRLAVVVGPPGVGKTALAFRAADRVRGSFPGGVLHADLQGFSDNEPVQPEQVLGRFLDDLGVQPLTLTIEGLSAAYRSTLAQRAVLVILDNARDLGQVLPLLPGPGPSAAVITSRNALVSLTVRHGANQFVVAPLAPDDGLALLSSIIGSERVTADPVAAGQLVQHCDGLPVAIVIIAARLLSRPRLTMGEVVNELTNATHKLTAFVHNDADLNLSATLDMSHKALTAGAAALLWRLGLHPGPTISRDAAQDLMTPANATPTALDELRAAHLIDEVAYNRFALHDLVRDYATEKAAGADGAGRRTTSERFLGHLLYNARGCDDVLAPGRCLPIGAAPADLRLAAPADIGAAMAWFAAEYDVIMAGIRHAAEHGMSAYTWLLPLTLTTFQWRSNRYLDAQRVLEQSLRAADEIATPAQRAMVLRLLAGADRGLGHPDLAKIRLATAIDLATDDGDSLGTAHGCHGLAVLHRETGDLINAEQRFRRALTTYRKLGDVAGEAGTLNGIGCTLADLGEYDDALATCTEALALFQLTGDDNGYANTLGSLADIRMATGDPSAAASELAAAAAIYHRLEYRTRESRTLQRLADSWREVGDRDQERAALSRALPLLRELRDPGSEPVAARLGELS